MTILLLADEPVPVLWEHLDRRRLEGIDLILSCGDLPAEYLSFLTCFTNAPIVYVHGNHDGRYEKEPPEGCIPCEGRLIVVNGLRILGLGGCMRYNRGPHQYTEGQMARRVLRLLPAILWHRGFDVLLTHAPALGQGDDEDLAHRGFAVFLRLMERFRPALMAHGHVHQNYRFDFRRERRLGETRIVNGFGSAVVTLDLPGRGKAGRARKQ